MMTHARGTFEVTLAPQPEDAVTGAAVGRMTVEKRYHGDIDGTGKGQMLAAMTSVKDSAGYVAIEHVTGKLADRSGSFLLQHSGTLTRGAQQLSIAVVPDSGTGGLAGISGTMTITIADGKHSYQFDYAFAGR